MAARIVPQQATLLLVSLVPKEPPEENVLLTESDNQCMIERVEGCADYRIRGRLWTLMNYQIEVHVQYALVNLNQYF